jgi:hypothetical protein
MIQIGAGYLCHAGHKGNYVTQSTAHSAVCFPNFIYPPNLFLIYCVLEIYLHSVTID